jgi:preprotein translocase subunit SecY
LFKTLANIFRIPELRTKILFTLAMLCIYRIGFHVPLPGVNGDVFKDAATKGVFGALANYLSLFSGGGFKQSTIFGLGIMPYISGSIIIQLLSTVVPSIEKLKKEGEPGIRKINEWTRYLAVPVCVVQASFLVYTLLNHDTGSRSEVFGVIQEFHRTLFAIMGVVVLTAGSMFLMWLGEQIEAYGIGNGISLIIAAGIVCNLPAVISEVIAKSPLSNIGNLSANHEATHSWVSAIRQVFMPANSTAQPYNIFVVLFMAVAFVAVVAGSILLTQAQRRIKITQAKTMRGRKVYGGQSSYLPLRVNHSGVMPIIFASSLMMLPQFVVPSIQSYANNNSFHVLNFILGGLAPGGYLYEVLYIFMIFFFSYFWNTVQFQPKEMADQLRDYGSFIPGLRPGKRTADYLEAVMTRITYVGAAFLCVIAVFPSIIASTMLGGDADAYRVTQFLGGTGLLIVIQVMLDLINRIEANLVMRNYTGFLEDKKNRSERQRNRIRGPVGGSKNFRGNKEELQK